jgi:hypothetical protein
MSEPTDDCPYRVLQCPACKDPHTTLKLRGPFTIIANTHGDIDVDDDHILEQQAFLDHTICFCEFCEHWGLLREFLRVAESGN